jgi:hypothetical protein
VPQNCAVYPSLRLINGWLFPAREVSTFYQCSATSIFIGVNAIDGRPDNKRMADRFAEFGGTILGVCGPCRGDGEMTYGIFPDGYMHPAADLLTEKPHASMALCCIQQWRRGTLCDGDHLVVIYRSGARVFLCNKIFVKTDI